MWKPHVWEMSSMTAAENAVMEIGGKCWRMESELQQTSAVIVIPHKCTGISTVLSGLLAFSASHFHVAVTICILIQASYFTGNRIMSNPPLGDVMTGLWNPDLSLLFRLLYWYWRIPSRFRGFSLSWVGFPFIGANFRFFPKKNRNYSVSARFHKAYILLLFHIFWASVHVSPDHWKVRWLEREQIRIESLASQNVKCIARQCDTKLKHKYCSLQTQLDQTAMD